MTTTRVAARNRARFTAAVALVIVGITAAVASATPYRAAGQKVSTVLIGAPLPLTGAGAPFGTTYLKGLQMTVDAINASGGIKSLGGAKLQLVVADDQGDVGRDIQLLNQMASQGVSVFAGPLLSATVIPSVSTFSRLQIPFVAPNLDDAVTDQGSQYVFRLVNRATGFTASVFQFLRASKLTKQIKRVGIVGINVPPGTSVTDRLASGAKKLGWDVTRIDYDQRATLDFSPIVSRLRDANVDFVLGYQNPNDAILFTKAMGGQSWRPRLGFLWVAGGYVLPSYLTSVGSIADNWLVANYVGPIAAQKAETPQLRALARQFQAETGVEMTGLAGGAPSTITAIAAALEKSKSTDPQKIRNALASLKWANAKAAPYPYWSYAGGLRFVGNGDNVGYKPTVTQLNATSGAKAVWPPNLATAKLVLPAK